jgi:hypothetical protein
MADEISIDVLALTMRAENALKDKGLDTISKLEEFIYRCKLRGSRGLREIHNIGGLSEKVILDELKFYREKHPHSIQLIDNVKPEPEIDYEKIQDNIILALRGMINTFKRDLEEGLHEHVKAYINPLGNDLHSKLLQHINELRTIVLEQSRILEGVQALRQPNGIINKIAEKIPGFDTTIYELYKKLYGE